MIDLAQGRAVQARGGDRARYRPVESVLTAGSRGDPVALVQAYREVVAARECYVADLDAIQGGPLQRDLLLELVRAAGPCGLLVDAGLRDASAATEVLALGVGAIIVGLETMRSVEDLAAVVAAAPARVIFSLDLRLGRPMLSPDAAGGELDGLAPEAIARLAVDYFGEPTYVFPLADCALLPIPNTTAEMLAEYLGTRVRDELARSGHRHLTLLEMEVEENYGQSATWREALALD